MEVTDGEEPLKGRDHPLTRQFIGPTQHPLPTHWCRGPQAGSWLRKQGRIHLLQALTRHLVPSTTDQGTGGSGFVWILRNQAETISLQAQRQPRLFRLDYHKLLRPGLWHQIH